MTVDPENIAHFCRACETWKTRADFSRDTIKVAGVKNECKLCQAERHRRQYRDDQNGYREYHLNKAHRRYYGGGAR